jgi:hypothetical protein
MGRPSTFTAHERALRDIGHKRFSKLLHTRVGDRMKSKLGSRRWDDFVHDALVFGKPLYMSAFIPGNVWCRGPIGGSGCTNALGLGAVQPSEHGRIHGDHTTDLNNICTAWSDAQATGTAYWHTGLRADLIMSAIFEFDEPHLVFRCDKCHSQLPHYANAVSKEDFALPGAQANPIVIDD